MLGGVSEITFEDLATGDVDLVWDFEVLSSENFDDYDDEQGNNFNTLSQELGGDAAIVAKNTGASINLGYIEGTRFFRDETFATEQSDLTDFFVDLPEQTNLVFTDQNASDLSFGRLFRFIDVAPIGVEMTPDGDLVTIFGEIDDGLLSIDNLIGGPIAPYTGAPDSFLSEFDSTFAADLSAVLQSGVLSDATSVLSDATISLLTCDVFDFV